MEGEARPVEGEARSLYGGRSPTRIMEGDKPDCCGPSPINYSTPCFSVYCRVVYLLYSTHPLLFVCVCVCPCWLCPNAHFSTSASRDIAEYMDPLYVLVPVPVRTDTVPVLVYETRARGCHTPGDDKRSNRQTVTVLRERASGHPARPPTR